MHAAAPPTHTLIATQEPDFTPGGQEDAPSFFWPMLLIFGIFWILLIAPQRKKDKQRRALLEQLGKGDKVLTHSGILGTVVASQENVITLQVADGVRIRILRGAIEGLVSDSGELLGPQAPDAPEKETSK